MVRRRADVAPLSSTFVDVIEPYEGASNIAAIHRLSLETPDGKLYPDTCVAVEIGLADGRRDLLISADAENPLGLAPSLSEGGKMVQKEWSLATDGELCWVRLNAGGEIERVALCHGNEVSVKGITLKLKQPADFIEIRFDDGVPSVVSGNPDYVSEVLIGGGNVWRP
jgi:hypothetical protein